MDRSAVSADKSSCLDFSKEGGSRIRPLEENDRKIELDPLRSLVQSRGCIGCGSSLESVAQRMASLPAAQKRQAALSLQQSKGNRFVHGMATAAPVQAKMMVGPARGEYERAACMPGAQAVQRQADPDIEEEEDDDILQGKFMPVQRASRTGEGRPSQGMAGGANVPKSEPQPNRTGMPDRLKAGIESLSGIDMSDVRVHANSDRPARLNALAYTQGNQIYLGPGQERHLPHEAWHAVQQKQDRVESTIQMKGKVNINDDIELEKEADVMGIKALRTKGESTNMAIPAGVGTSPVTLLIQLKDLNREKLNVVGEDHRESDPRRKYEEDYVETKGISRSNYWTETQYKYSVYRFRMFGIKLLGIEYYGDPTKLRVEKFLVGMREKLFPLVDEFGQGKVPNLFKNKIQSLDVAWNSFTKSIVTREIKNIRLNVFRTIEVSGEYKLSTKFIPMLGLLDTLNEEYENRKAITDTSEIQKDTKEFKEKWAKLEEYFITKIKGEPISSEYQVDKRRSYEMNNAAKLSASTIGVWKVGQAHIDDIKVKPEFNEGKLKYNILTKDEFNQGYVPWMSKKEEIDALRQSTGETYRYLP